MKLDSKLFDSIRIAPNKGKRKQTAANGAESAKEGAVCQWEGCTNPGVHKAPAGRHRENEYFLFCTDHVREYNKNYNYFSGLEDDEVHRIQKDLTQGRPTWKMGTNATAAAPEFAKMRSGRAGYYKRLGVSGPAAPSAGPQTRRLRPLEKKAIRALGLPENADANTIRTRYKELVKQNHPDVNGGSRESEERLQEVLNAYKVLKAAGMTS